MGDESVRVAVRVRPFNQREKDRNAVLVIEMSESMTRIKDPDNPDQPPKEFSFDFSYWSHDGFEEDEKGYYRPTSDRYSDQRMVFNDLGQGVLNNAMDGFNCSLFAYGQTGSGKSYSMVGYGANRGIVPITCDELFKIIESSTDTEKKYQVTFSMLEIYNEQVRDLLTKDNPKGGLQVRQNPKLGLFYVQDLKSVAVGSYKEIESRMEEGTANRTVAATQMNATSSRAHTVVTITFDQLFKNDMGEDTKKTSVVNLVDLAGSERADSTGATGDRLKEGANINKSLSALGNVISALADVSMGKKKVLVPYRDSVLTKLLQNALGGNSKTIMIAALSPADINYDETLSTLRYADRAKKIKNKAIVNENPVEKLIRTLKEENERLKKILESGGAPVIETGATMTAEDLQRMRMEMEEEMKAQLQANMQAMMNWDEKLLKDRSEVHEDDNISKKQTVPHFINLNEDPQLSGVICHFVGEGETVIGKQDADEKPAIILSGLSIQKHHAVVKKDNSEVTIKPGTLGAQTKVNGTPLTGERKLMHLDRLVFGSSHCYYFVNPLSTQTVEGTPEVISWEFMQKELAKAKGFGTSAASGLTKDQLEVQEQILELLPMVNEVNAICEEMDKHRSFEVVLMSAALLGGNAKGTRVLVKMKDLLNDNIWLWDKGKFCNRRFLMQEMYQKLLDGDSSVKQVSEEEDPFWEPLEDVLIGTANVFLQNLSFVLDFDDRITITDYKGEEEGGLVVSVVPCNESGKALDDDCFVEEPAELLGKPYYFKVTIRSADISKSRYKHGLYLKYKAFGDDDFTFTETVADTLTPEFKHSRIMCFPEVTQEVLDWFETSCITFLVYAKQIDAIPDQRLTKMTTKELRMMDQGAKRSPNRSAFRANDFTETAHLKAEIILLKRKHERLLDKEIRIQNLVTEWGKKDPEDQKFDTFHRAISAAAFYKRGQLKYKVNMLQAFLKGQKNAVVSVGTMPMEETPSSDVHTTEDATLHEKTQPLINGSRACVVM